MNLQCTLTAGLIAFLAFAFSSCSDSDASITADNDEVEVLENWPNGVVKKDRVHLVADTFKVSYYHENYKLNMTGRTYYLEGKEIKHGNWVSYYQDGVKWSQDIYDKGVQNGAYMTWHPNGTPYISGHHTEGAMTGVWTIQDSTGVVVKTFDSTPK